MGGARDVDATLLRFVAEWKLGRRPIEDMPAAAVQALTDGLDLPTLAVLAGMDGASWSEIKPVADRVVDELGGPPTEQEAKLLVADAWLAEVAAGRDPGSYDDFSLTEEILRELGGDYEWFRLAIYDLEILHAIEDPRGRDRAVIEIRERAARILEKPRDQRLSASTPSLEDRPFIRPEPAEKRSRFLRWPRRPQ